MTLFTVLKLIHILSATLLFGTGLGSAFYLWRTHRAGEIAAVARVAREVVFADWVFTTPAVAVQLATGLGMMHLAGYSFADVWLLAGLVLYLIAGVCWLPVVWIQIRVRELAASAVAGGVLPPEYHRLMRVWFLLGWPAFLAVLLAFALMVFRPTGLWN